MAVARRASSALKRQLLWEPVTLLRRSAMAVETLVAAALPAGDGPAYRFDSSQCPWVSCPAASRPLGCGTWEAGGVRVSPMFPLGTVLVPGMALPLHVFEPRYSRMVDDCRAGDGTFGVVLIERGSEVGGGDVRTDVGTLARIAQAEALPDGRWMLVAQGVQRIRVERWLPDDPYPRAEIVDWPEEPGAEPSATRPDAAPGRPGGDVERGGDVGAATTPPDVTPSHAYVGNDRAEITTLLRRVAALRREIGEPAAPIDLELDDDPVAASYQSIVVSHLGTADRQRLLAAPTLDARSALLRELLADQIELLQARLARG
jgi:Lon protease-like protein